MDWLKNGFWASKRKALLFSSLDAAWAVVDGTEGFYASRNRVCNCRTAYKSINKHTFRPHGVILYLSLSIYIFDPFHGPEGCFWWSALLFCGDNNTTRSACPRKDTEPAAGEKSLLSRAGNGRKIVKDFAQLISQTQHHQLLSKHSSKQARSRYSQRERVIFACMVSEKWLHLGHSFFLCTPSVAGWPRGKYSGSFFETLTFSSYRLANQPNDFLHIIWREFLEICVGVKNKKLNVKRVVVQLIRIFIFCYCFQKHFLRSSLVRITLKE